MIASINWHGDMLQVDLGSGTDISITLDPHGPQPSFFAGNAASVKPLEAPGYIGSVSGGGSCNADVLQYVPHCHGTHTECIGHLLADRVTVLESIDQAPSLARLVTLAPAAPADTEERYLADLPAEEHLLTLEALQSLLQDDELDCDALVVRTKPNEPAKRYTDYAKSPPYPVFSHEAMQWLSDGQWKHLLLDQPSLDRAHDGGRLANHRQWWGLNAEAPAHAGHRSVTEMVYVRDELPDGFYWLDLQLQPLASDAVSSRPILYPAQRS